MHNVRGSILSTGSNGKITYSNGKIDCTPFKSKSKKSQMKKANILLNIQPGKAANDGGDAEDPM
jgi:hypothetical protein